MIAIDELLAGREVGPSDREQLRTVLRDLLADGPEPAESADDRPMMFESLEAWLEDFWLPLYTRALSPSRVWCPRWFEHPEARSRLLGLWYAWEAIADRNSRAALSDWWRDHADYQMGRLMDPQGPFQGCSPQAHSEHERPQLGNETG